MRRDLMVVFEGLNKIKVAFVKILLVTPRKLEHNIKNSIS